MIRLAAILGTVLVFATATAAEPTLPNSVLSVISLRQLPPESLSVYVEDLDSGEVLLEWQELEPRNPGSTIKLLTTLVALDVLGPGYVWRTKVYALGAVESGQLRGDLLIKGDGDPFLVTERVWQLLRNIRSAGIQSIDGDLLIDDSYFQVGAHDPAAFDRQPLRAYNVTPNALLMNFKVVRYWFEPEPDNNRVYIRLDPPLANVRIDNKLALTPGRCRGYQRGITISANSAVDQMTFSGKFPSGCQRYAMDRTALSHNAYVYGLFMALWEESGGTLSGSWRRALVPQDAEPIVEFPSVPLADAIARVNKYSNNVMARQLLYTLSAEVLGEPGTEAGGRKVVGDWLHENDLDFSALAFHNGAGLSRDARMSARDLGTMLRFAWRQPYMPEYVSSLSLSGVDGTLRSRFEDPALTGNAHLKTGSLDDVTAIAGYLQSRSGKRFAVVTMQNYPDVHRGPGAEVQEALLRWVFEQ
jgi:D-alanyl-D-alanine carboxypeptidase/D-alanyl-D-alanine-endopeptidase (penicillin-binding protein 4)